MKKIILIFCLMTSFIYSQQFTLFTQPKTGTHLLIPILESLTGKHVYWAKQFQENTKYTSDEYLDLGNSSLIYFAISKEPWTKDIMDTVWKRNESQGTFLHLHPPYSRVMEEYLLQNNCINFFVKRDPRDTIVSLLNHYRYIALNDNSLEGIDSDEERLLIMIQKDLRRHTLSYMGWLSSPACCVLDFSKLMGTQGGTSTDTDALKELIKIASALKLRITRYALNSIYKASFGHGWNFFKGKVGSWKEYFNDAHKIAVKEQIGDLLIELGYEKDLNW